MRCEVLIKADRNVFFFFSFVVVLQLMVLQPAIAHQEEQPPSVKELLQDPYIIIASGFDRFLFIARSFINHREIIFRGHHHRQHGHCHAGTVAAHLDDGHHVRS